MDRSGQLRHRMNVAGVADRLIGYPGESPDGRLR